MIRLAACLVCLAGPLHAGGLMERTVTFGVLAYDDPERPVYVGERHAATVSNDIEYGLGPEGFQNGWDVVPAIVDIRDAQIIVTYPDILPGTFPEAEFNGYVLDFLTECVLFNGAEQDVANSTAVLPQDAVFVDGAKLYVNLSGQDYGPQTFFVISVDVADCPLS